jgi:hypothetical protein
MLLRLQQQRQQQAGEDQVAFHYHFQNKP